MSRLNPKKGVLLMLEAWAAVGRSDWRLKIVGPDEEGHAKVISEAIRHLGLSETVTLSSFAPEERKWGVIQQCDVFILPSFSENFGIVVAEALACSKPVITTHGTPWESLVKNRCGWWVAASTDALANAMDEAMRLPPDELERMGERGRAFVSATFEWKAIATQMMAAYQWLIAGGSAPDCICV